MSPAFFAKLEQDASIKACTWFVAVSASSAAHDRLAVLFLTGAIERKHSEALRNIIVPEALAGNELGTAAHVQQQRIHPAHNDRWGFVRQRDS